MPCQILPLLTNLPTFFPPQADPPARLAALASLLEHALEVSGGRAHTALPRMAVAFSTTQLKVPTLSEHIACALLVSPLHYQHTLLLHYWPMTIHTLLHTMSVALPRILIQKLADFSEALHSHSIPPHRTHSHAAAHDHHTFTLNSPPHIIPFGPMMIQLLHTLIAWPSGLAL